MFSSESWRREKKAESDKIHFLTGLAARTENGSAVPKIGDNAGMKKIYFLAYRVLEKAFRMCYNHSRAYRKRA